MTATGTITNAAAKGAIPRHPEEEVTTLPMNRGSRDHRRRHVVAEGQGEGEDRAGRDATAGPAGRRPAGTSSRRGHRDRPRPRAATPGCARGRQRRAGSCTAARGTSRRAGDREDGLGQDRGARAGPSTEFSTPSLDEDRVARSRPSPDTSTQAGSAIEMARSRADPRRRDPGHEVSDREGGRGPRSVTSAAIAKVRREPRSGRSARSGARRSCRGATPERARW